MKKFFSVLLVLLLMVSLIGCRSDEPTTGDDGNTDGDGTELTYKIGIITGTVSQNEEEYQAAAQMKEKYGDMIITATYPDNFNDETEQTIAAVTGLANDPLCKAIVFVQAVPGTSAAIDKVRETNPDMLFICGVVAEPPAQVASKADICLLVDEIAMGTTVIEQAAAQGAETFVHISFARHLGYDTIAARREGFIATCEELGIEYVEATAPDPTGDAGVPGAQQWIIENVPKYVEEYGVNTAFFSTNCSMQEPLIRTVAEQGAIYPQQCCPSPYHGYPGAFNIDVTGHEGDVDYVLGEIEAKVTEYGNNGRMSTWTVPVNMLMVEAGVEYAIEFCEGNTNGRVDEAVLFNIFNEVAGGSEVTVSNYVDADEGELDNFYMLLCPFYNF